MTSRKVALSAILALGLAAPATAAVAYDFPAPSEHFLSVDPDDDLTTGSLGGTYGAPRSGWCAPSSASEGNANQQTWPVMQYGQTSGGNRC